MNTRSACLVIGLVLVVGLLAPAQPARAESVYCALVAQPTEYAALQPVLPGALVYEALSDLGSDSVVQADSNDGFVVRTEPYTEFAYFDYQGQENGLYQYVVTGAVDCRIESLVARLMQCLKDLIIPCEIVNFLNAATDPCIPSSEACKSVLTFVDWAICTIQQFQRCPNMLLDQTLHW